MDWLRTTRADPRAAALADRHYSRKTCGERKEPMNPSFTDQVSPFLAAVARECERTRCKHPTPIRSPHEGFAIILEEVDELKAEVWRQQKKRHALYTELVQVAAMCQRMAEDCGLTPETASHEKGHA